MSSSRRGECDEMAGVTKQLDVCGGSQRAKSSAAVTQKNQLKISIKAEPAKIVAWRRTYRAESGGTYREFHDGNSNEM